MQQNKNKINELSNSQTLKLELLSTKKTDPSSESSTRSLDTLTLVRTQKVVGSGRVYVYGISEEETEN